MLLSKCSIGIFSPFGLQLLHGKPFEEFLAGSEVTVEVEVSNDLPNRRGRLQENVLIVMRHLIDERCLVCIQMVVAPVISRMIVSRWGNNFVRCHGD